LDATGIHPEIHKQVYELIEKEFGIKKKDLKLPMDAKFLSSFVKEGDRKAVEDLSEKYGI